MQGSMKSEGYKSILELTILSQSLDSFMSPGTLENSEEASSES